MSAGGKPAAWRRWSGILLRTAHIASIVVMGAGLMGAVSPAVPFGPAAVFITGVLLLAIELADGRIRIGEVAGVVVVAKLVIVAWLIFDETHAKWLFWTLLAVSALSSHAPRDARHWHP